MGSRARACLVALFRPATAFTGRLRYAQKFVVVGLVLLVPLGFVSTAYVGLQRTQIALSTLERQGLQYVTPLINLAGVVVQARHMAVGTGSDASLDLDTGLGEVDRVDQRLGGVLDVRDTWRATRKLVVGARSNREQPKDKRFQAYNEAIDALLALIATVGDHSRLILDPDLDTYYLVDTLQFRLPSLCDTAGRIADRIDLSTLSQASSDFDRFVEIGTDYGAVSSNLASISRAVELVVKNTDDSQVRRNLNKSFRQFDQATTALNERLGTAIRNRAMVEFPSLSADHVRIASSMFAAAVSSALDRLLQARIERLSNRAREIELGAGLAGLLAVYLFVGFYRSVSVPIRRIVETLRAVAAGDLARRVKVNTHDELSFVAAVLNDTVAKTEAATEDLAIQATRDSLTGLPNRTVVVDRLDHALARTARSDSLMAVIFVDLDRFKLINDSCGHEAGDEVLRAVAERMTATTRSSDTVARLAGDEFVVISEDLGEPEEAVQVAERIVRAVSEPIMLTAAGVDRDVSVGASVGIAFAAGATAPSVSDLLRDADVAMYWAKQRGRGRVEIFDDSLRVTIERRAETQQDLRRALDSDELRVYYQPIVATATGRTLGFEALVRWEHPARGLLPPGEFIDAAEECGLIVPLGAQVLMEACRQAAQWRADTPGAEGLHIAVNVSAAQFAHPSFVPTVASVLEHTGLDPDALWLEMTETSILSDVEAAGTILDAIRALGPHLVIDDFGTGYSSLTYLRQFPVEVLKIDRSFVSGLGKNREDQAIVEMIISLAHTLDLLIIAEGVETPAQLSELRRLGCGASQGYHFGRPAPAEEAWGAVEHTLNGGRRVRSLSD